MLQALLVRHAEALLLVDDHEPEVGELDGAVEHPVGADQDVDIPLAGAPDHLPRVAV